jgi:hypothetical protein
MSYALPRVGPAIGSPFTITNDGLVDGVSDAAVRHAIEEGWFVADSEPLHSVRLGVVQREDQTFVPAHGRGR